MSTRGGSIWPVVLVLTILGLVCGGDQELSVAGQQAPNAPKEMTAKELAKGTQNAIVRIETFGIAEYEVKVGKGKDEKLVKVEKEVSGGGTGFVVSGGFVVTNNHVLGLQPLKGAKSVKILGFRGTFAFDTQDPLGQVFIPPGDPRRDLINRVLALEVVNRDALSDLAVLRVEPIGSAVLDAGRRKHVAAQLEKYALSFAPPGATEVGDDVVAIGFPRLFRLEGMPTVTKGIVSALDRETMEGEVNHTDLIQTDAAINPGNSGGPLFDTRGRVVGVNTFSWNHIDTPGVGFARSARTAEPIVKLLQQPKGIQRPNLGFTTGRLTKTDVEQLDVVPGLLVASVHKDGPAAGLQPWDIIVSVNNEHVARPGDLNNALALATGATEVRMTVWRLPDDEVKKLAAGEDIGFGRRFLHPATGERLQGVKKIDLVIKVK